MEFLAALHIRRLKLLDVQLHSHPMCTEPPTALWERLDSMLQMVWCQRLKRVAVSEIPVNTGSSTVVWGDSYLHGRYDPVVYRRKMAELLPSTHGRHLLFHLDDPYSPPERVPSRVKPFLPIEIAERIMDFVSGTEAAAVDTIWDEGVSETLAACSLTCRDWKPRAQAHLFRVVSLAGAQRDDHNTSSFLYLLTQHPALGPFIRTFTVHDTPSPPSKSPTLHIAPFQLLGALPQLERLRFLDGTFYPPPRIPFDTCMRRSSSIVSLWIEKVVFYSVNDLRRVINACMNMKAVRLMRCVWRGNPKATVSGLRLPTSVRLKEVIIFGEAQWVKEPRTTNFLQWLVHSGALASTEYLHLPRFIAGADSMLAASQSAIHTCRNTLTTLFFPLSPGIDYSCCEFTSSHVCDDYRLVLTIA